jgi:3alpha(or 20beta)-hydroxysteroid dehydrogenase
VLGDAAAYVHLDVTDEASWAAVVDATEARFGRLDVLVNNAASSGSGRWPRRRWPTTEPSSR